tara:strand:+ start:279 stop:806 length:528 start_codon:yes stop_codon:yes gene_type:complete
MKLHLGCGKRDFGTDWIHIDQADYDHIIHKDVTNLRFADGSCDVIYASHLLEYFSRSDASKVLGEWYRCLKPGGVLRLAVPDFASICNLYKNGYSLSSFLGPLYGEMGDPPFYHKTVYDYASLKTILYDCGFKSVSKYDWRDTDHAEFDDHSQAYLPHMDKDNGTLISLNVEAVK